MRKLISVVVLIVSSLALAQAPTSRPYPGVELLQEKQADPIQSIYIARIDLTSPNISVRVSRGGDDPDGPGKWQTTLMQPTRIADREGFDLVVNGDFFQVPSAKDAEDVKALSVFIKGLPSRVVGPAATDGKAWSSTTKPYPSLMIDAEKRPSIVTVEEPPAEAQQLISGHDMLVKGGQNVAPAPTSGFTKGPHPRTGVGLADGGKTLVLVVVDGRQKEHSIGMSLRDFAEIFVRQGCSDAINLDGGGSSVMALRDPETRKMKILNVPSDKDKQGVSHERAVGNVLGITAAPRPAARPTN